MKLGAMRVRAWEDLRVTITPPKPFAKGVGTGITLEELILRPVRSAAR
jgi:hypothetical protein